MFRAMLVSLAIVKQRCEAYSSKFSFRRGGVNFESRKIIRGVRHIDYGRSVLLVPGTRPHKMERCVILIRMSRGQTTRQRKTHRGSGKRNKARCVQMHTAEKKRKEKEPPGYTRELAAGARC